MIRINQIKLPIDHKEAAFEKKIKKALQFILYVFECPQNGPINRRVAYISYLDRYVIRYL